MFEKLLGLERACKVRRYLNGGLHTIFKVQNLVKTKATLLFNKNDKKDFILVDKFLMEFIISVSKCICKNFAILWKQKMKLQVSSERDLIFDEFCHGIDAGFGGDASEHHIFKLNGFYHICQFIQR